jgi:hypothetical protein
MTKEEMEMATFTHEEALAIAKTTRDHVGMMNVLAISGGKWKWNYDDSGVDVVLPCGYGYSVRVRYERARDTYTVSREFSRKFDHWVKGEVSNVYCDEVGEVAYRAGMFRDEWTTAGAHKVH